MELYGISVIQIIVWAVFGFIVGIVVHTIDHGDVKGGLLGTMLLGLAGSLLGGFLARSVFHITQDTLSVQGFLFAVVGGLILSALYRIIFRERGSIKTTETQLR